MTPKVEPVITEFVNEFVKKPLRLTEISITDPEITNWGNLLTLLHVLLVKFDIKKAHFMHDAKMKNYYRKNHSRISKKLDILMKKQTVISCWSLFYETSIFPNSMIQEMIKSTANNVKVFLYSKDKKVFNELSTKDRKNLHTKTGGRISEYPDCCVLWLMKEMIGDLETAYRIYEKKYGINPSTTVRETLEFTLKNDDNESLPPIAIRAKKRYEKQFGVGRVKFPFCFHQPCDDCLEQKNSPSELLNNKYAKFAKENFPLLYDAIINASKKESDYFMSCVKAIADSGIEDEDFGLGPLTDPSVFRL